MESKKEVEVLTVEEEQVLEDNRKTSSLTGFIFALLSWHNGLGLFGLVFAILGLVFTSKGSKVKSPNHRSFKTVGKTLSIIQLVLCIVIPMIVFCVLALALFIYIVVALVAVIGTAIASMSAATSGLFE